MSKICICGGRLRTEGEQDYLQCADCGLSICSALLGAADNSRKEDLYPTYLAIAKIVRRCVARPGSRILDYGDQLCKQERRLLERFLPEMEVSSFDSTEKDKEKKETSTPQLFQAIVSVDEIKHLPFLHLQTYFITFLGAPLSILAYRDDPNPKYNTITPEAIKRLCKIHKKLYEYAFLQNVRAHVYIIRDFPIGDEQKICVGIGDILLYTTVFLNTRWSPTVIIDREMVHKYRFKADEYIKFVTTLLDRAKIKYRIVERSALPYLGIHYFTRYIDNWNILRSHYPLPLLIQKELNNRAYLVIHTKCRLDKGYIVPYEEINQFCQSFRTKLPIYIMGERTISQNFENTYIGTMNTYPLLKQMADRNEVYDITEENVQEEIDLAKFDRDLGIMAHAECNLIFGIGGNFVMPVIFSKKCIAYVATLYYEMFEYIPQHTICKTMSEWRKAVEVYAEK